MVEACNLVEEATLLNSKYENMAKFVWRLNNGSNVLVEILEVGRTSTNMKRIGFDNGIVIKEIKVPTNKFFPL